MYKPIRNLCGSFVHLTPEATRSWPPAGATIRHGGEGQSCRFTLQRALNHNTSNSVSTQLHLQEWAGDTDICCKHMWRCQGPLYWVGSSVLQPMRVFTLENSAVPYPKEPVLPLGCWLEAAGGKQCWKRCSSVPTFLALADGDPASSRGHPRNCVTFVEWRQGDSKHRLWYC